MPMPLRLASAALARRVGSPAMQDLAGVGLVDPHRIFISVDLPAPFSPIRPTTSPRPDLDRHVLQRMDAGEALVDADAATSGGCGAALI